MTRWRSEVTHVFSLDVVLKDQLNLPLNTVKFRMCAVTYRTFIAMVTRITCC